MLYLCLLYAMDKHSLTTSYQIESEYWMQSVPNPKRVILLLHGFSQRGESLFNKLKKEMPEDAIVISPNAPFPSPVKLGDEYKEAYAWYFYLSKEKRFVIHPTGAVNYLETLLKATGYLELPTTVIGFSQGGYMGPWLVKALHNVEHVISVAADYPSHYYEGLRPYRFDIIHGSNDKIAPLAEVKLNVDILKNKGRICMWHEVEAAHEVNEAVIQKISSLIK